MEVPMGKLLIALCKYCEQTPLLDDVHLTGERRCETGRDAEDCPQYEAYLVALASEKGKKHLHGRRQKSKT